MDTGMHSSNETLLLLIWQGHPWTLRVVSADRIINSGLWPAHSPELNPRDFIFGEL